MNLETVYRFVGFIRRSLPYCPKDGDIIVTWETVAHDVDARFGLRGLEVSEGDGRREEATVRVVLVLPLTDDVSEYLRTDLLPGVTRVSRFQ